MYYRARYYDPQIGIFVSPDTIVPDPTNLLDYNRYMYVRGNPLKYTDPTGHVYETDGGGISPQQYYYEHYTNSPDAYVDAHLIIVGQREGNWDKAVDTTGYAHEYSEYNLNEPFEIQPDIGIFYDAVGNPNENTGLLDLLGAAGIVFADGFEGPGSYSWSSGVVRRGAKELVEGSTSVHVNSRSEAEELYLGVYHGSGYTNTTGMTSTEARRFMGGSRNGTYHWDDALNADGTLAGHAGTHGAYKHLQIHTHEGSVIRVNYGPRLPTGVE